MKKNKIFNLFLLTIVSILGKCEIAKTGPQKIPTSLAIEEAVERHVDIYHENGLHLGSGVYFSEGGDIFTEYSIATYLPNELKITPDGDNFFPIKQVAWEKNLDLAIVKADYKKSINEPQLKDRNELNILENVFLVGSPYTLEKTYIQGYISHLDRTGIESKFPLIPFIQIAGMSYENTTGTGVYTLDGKLVGINRKSEVTGQENGFGLVVPAGFLRAFWEKYQKN